MSDTILVALLSLAGTLLGSVFGILASNKLTSFRLQKLEEKVQMHNNLIERMYKVEERSKSNSHRIDSIEEKIGG